MGQLSRQTVRHAWAPYAGAVVALALGTALLATAVLVTSAAEQAGLEDLATLLGMMAGVALFMAVFVVGSTFGFVVASRRRQLGLLRLVGATPRQVRRLVLGESVVVAVVAALLGCGLALGTAPLFVALLGADLDLPAPWTAWAVAAPTGLGVALLGTWRASLRAARTSPIAALAEAGAERRRPSLWQALIGTACLGIVVVAFALTDALTPLFALVAAILLPEVVVVGLYSFGGLVFPALAGLLARPFAGRDIAARLARDHVRTAVRTPVALAAPVLAVSAVAGSLVLTLSFVADWTTALDREQLAAPYVVTGGDDTVGDRLAGLPVVDPRIVLDLRLRGGEESVDVIDPRTVVAARGMQVLDGRLTARGAAVSETAESDLGVHLGDRLLGTRVTAIVRDAPDLYGEVVVGRAAVADRLAGVRPQAWFVDPGHADLGARLAGSGARVQTADAWVDGVDAATRANNDLGLWVLLGPAGVYAGIAIVNAVLVGVSQRRAQLRTAALLGATPAQLRRVALWEAGLVGGAGLLTGSAVTAGVGLLVRTATAADVAGQALTIPWLPLTGIALTCAALTILAALVGARRVVRPVRW